jgi:hypothetical protein
MTAITTDRIIDRTFAETIAREWIAAWNAQDVERVLSHYADDVEMASPYIRQIAGEVSGVLKGKDALRAYWNAALQRLPELHFTLREVFFSAQSVALYYDAAEGKQAVECLHFGPEGLVTRAAAHYNQF